MGGLQVKGSLSYPSHELSNARQLGDGERRLTASGHVGIPPASLGNPF